MKVLAPNNLSYGNFTAKQNTVLSHFFVKEPLATITLPIYTHEVLDEDDFEQRTLVPIDSYRFNLEPRITQHSQYPSSYLVEMVLANDDGISFTFLDLVDLYSLTENGDVANQQSSFNENTKLNIIEISDDRVVQIPDSDFYMSIDSFKELLCELRRAQLDKYLESFNFSSNLIPVLQESNKARTIFKTELPCYDYEYEKFAKVVSILEIKEVPKDGELQKVITIGGKTYDYMQYLKNLEYLHSTEDWITSEDGFSYIKVSHIYTLLTSLEIVKIMNGGKEFYGVEYNVSTLF